MDAYTHLWSLQALKPLQPPLTATPLSRFQYNPYFTEPTPLSLPWL